MSLDLNPKNIEREALLRFWAAMNSLDYDWVVDEYLGKPHDESLLVINKLYQNIEAAVHFIYENRRQLNDPA